MFWFQDGQLTKALCSSELWIHQEIKTRVRWKYPLTDKPDPASLELGPEWACVNLPVPPQMHEYPRSELDRIRPPTPGYAVAKKAPWQDSALSRALPRQELGVGFPSPQPDHLDEPGFRLRWEGREVGKWVDISYLLFLKGRKFDFKGSERKTGLERDAPADHAGEWVMPQEVDLYFNLLFNK